MRSTARVSGTTQKKTMTQSVTLKVKRSLRFHHIQIVQNSLKNSTLCWHITWSEKTLSKNPTNPLTDNENPETNLSGWHFLARHVCSSQDNRQVYW